MESFWVNCTDLTRPHAKRWFIIAPQTTLFEAGEILYFTQIILVCPPTTLNVVPDSDSLGETKRPTSIKQGPMPNCQGPCLIPSGDSLLSVGVSDTLATNMKPAWGGGSRKTNLLKGPGGVQSV